MAWGGQGKPYSGSGKVENAHLQLVGNESRVVKWKTYPGKWYRGRKGYVYKNFTIAVKAICSCNTHLLWTCLISDVVLGTRGESGE